MSEECFLSYIHSYVYTGVVLCFLSSEGEKRNVYDDAGRDSVGSVCRKTCRLLAPIWPFGEEGGDGVGMGFEEYEVMTDSNPPNHLLESLFPPQTSFFTLSPQTLTHPSIHTATPSPSHPSDQTLSPFPAFHAHLIPCSYKPAATTDVGNPRTSTWLVVKRDSICQTKILCCLVGMAVVVVVVVVRTGRRW